jgi:hypothetical protein
MIEEECKLWDNNQKLVFKVGHLTTFSVNLLRNDNNYKHIK